jgi:acyl-CoA synthetase (AMP-forming)/AMP-acid ligase II
LFANKRACIVASINSQPMALSHQLAPAYNQQTSATDLAGKIDKNIVTSPHSDCELHGLTLVQRYFQNASKYSNKIALVCIQFISNLILFRNCRRVFYYLTGFDFAFDSQECGVTGRKYTYEMLGHLIRKCGSALTRAGYKKGDVMAIISPNVPEFPVALLGAASVGMPVALVNPTFTPGMCQKIS